MSGRRAKALRRAPRPALQWHEGELHCLPLYLRWYTRQVSLRWDRQWTQVPPAWRRLLRRRLR